MMSVVPYPVIMACHQNAMKRKASETRVSSVILGFYQSVGVDGDDQSSEPLENYANLDEIIRFSNKKFDSSHDVHRPFLKAKKTI